MNLDNTSFLLQTFLPVARVLLAITVISFSYCAMATDVVSDDQIRRVAKIARATKTDITVTKERVTVTVHGSGKKMSRKAKKTIGKIMKQKNYVPKQSYYPQDPPDFARTAPVLNNTGFRPPPVLGAPGYSSHPPVLEKLADEDPSYY